MLHGHFRTTSPGRDDGGRTNMLCVKRSDNAPDRCRFIRNSLRSPRDIRVEGDCENRSSAGNIEKLYGQGCLDDKRTFIVNVETVTIVSKPNLRDGFHVFRKLSGDRRSSTGWEYYSFIAAGPNPRLILLLLSAIRKRRRIEISKKAYGKFR